MKSLKNERGAYQFDAGSVVLLVLAIIGVVVLVLAVLGKL